MGVGGFCGGCCGCNTTICVLQCGSLPVFGASVAILSGGSTVAAGTTGGTGCVTLSIPSAGSYTLQATVSGTMVYNASRALSCNGTTNISITAADVVCCGGCAIPYDLTLTDAVGSLSFIYYTGSGTCPTWYGGRIVTELSCPVTTPGGICVSGAPSSGPVRICYSMICCTPDPGDCCPNQSSALHFAVQRAWSWVYKPGTFTPIWYQDPTGITPGYPCPTGPPLSCGSPLTDTSGFGANPSSTSPFVLSGTPVAAPSNATADPIGGTVVISA